MAALTFCTRSSPVGEILLLQRGASLAGLHVLDDTPTALEDRLREATGSFGMVPEHDPEPSREVCRQLQEYFDGDRRTFEVPLDWGTTHGFALAALRTVCEIPYAQTAGYGEVAALAGAPRAARAVGNACARSPFSIVVPVHRVVHADGRIGGYGGRAHIKRRLLEGERAHAD